MIMFLAVVVSKAAAVAAPLGPVELEKALAPYHQLRSVEGNFEQELWLKDADVKLNSQGHFRIQDPKTEEFNLLWAIEKPHPSKVEMDHKEIRITQGKGPTEKIKTLKVSDIGSQNQDLAQMTVWMRLEPQEILKKFDVFQQKDHLELRPKSEKSLFRSVKVYLHPQGYIQKTEILESTENRMQITFSKVKVKKAND